MRCSPHLTRGIHYMPFWLVKNWLVMHLFFNISCMHMLICLIQKYWNIYLHLFKPYSLHSRPLNIFLLHTFTSLFSTVVCMRNSKVRLQLVNCLINIKIWIEIKFPNLKGIFPGTYLNIICPLIYECWLFLSYLLNLHCYLLKIS